MGQVMTAWGFNRRKGNKYGNKRTKCSKGHNHRSQLEASVCALITLREKAGELKLIKTEQHLYLTEARIKYIADFTCGDVKSGEVFYIEAKGYASQRWPMIVKLWRKFGLGKLEIWKGTAARPKLAEIIVPKCSEPEQTKEKVKP